MECVITFINRGTDTMVTGNTFNNR